MLRILLYVYCICHVAGAGDEMRTREWKKNVSDLRDEGDWPSATTGSGDAATPGEDPVTISRSRTAAMIHTMPGQQLPLPPW